MTRGSALVAALALALAPAGARAAEPHALKLAAISPDGTYWSRELRSAMQEIEAATDGAVRVKLYLGAVAGDETEVAARIAKGQLDAVGSAGVLCDMVSPTLRAISIPGLFATRAEAVAVSQKLRPQIDDEAQKAGFAMLAIATLGQDVLFTRTPVRSLAELRALKLWRWDGDEAGIATARAMGLEVVPTPVHEAMAAMEAGRLDGFMAIPTAALAFQWSTRTRYLTSLRAGHLNGCVLVANRAFDRLPIEHQQAVRAAMAKVAVRFEEISEREDEALVGELFARQGLTVSAPSPALRADFFAAAEKARAALADAIVPRAVVARVLKALAEVRAK
ncbi:MAG TPA: TRAP transporter substrate-binding protein DctP [Polyangia bacterium]